jgi:flagellar protein FlbD
MIKITRLDGKAYYHNPHQIESIETRPDTVPLMLFGKPVAVREAADDIIDRMVACRRRRGGFRNEE